MRNTDVIRSLNQVKWSLLNGAVLLNVGNPKETIKSEFCKRIAAELGEDVETLTEFTARDCRPMSLTGIDTLNFAKFIGEIRREIIDVGRAEDEDLPDGLKASIKELDRIFALFQLACVEQCGENAALHMFHIPNFIKFTNRLLQAPEAAETLSEAELAELGSYLGVDLAIATIDELYNRFYEVVKQVIPNSVRLSVSANKAVALTVDPQQAGAGVQETMRCDELYKRWRKTFPTLDLGSDIKVQPWQVINYVYEDIYNHAFIPARYGNKNLNFYKTTVKYIDLWHKPTTEIDQMIEPLLKGLENRVWYQNKIFSSLTLANIVAVGASFACLADGIFRNPSSYWSYFSRAALTCSTICALAPVLSYYADSENRAQIWSNIPETVFSISLMLNMCYGGLMFLPVYKAFSDLRAKVPSKNIASIKLSGKIIGLDIAINAAVGFAYGMCLADTKTPIQIM